MKKLLVALMTLCLILSMGFAVAEETHYTIAYAPQSMANDFFIAVGTPIQAAVEARGDTYVTIDPQGDQARMNDMIGDLIVQGVDVILTIPKDSAGIAPALTACAEAGIPVINIDTAVADTELVETIIESDNYQAGVVMGDLAMQDLPEGSKIAILNQVSANCTILREQGFRDTIGDYFEIVATFECNGDTAAGMTLTEDLLQSTPDIAGIFCINDMSACGAANAVIAHPEIDHDVLIYAVDGNPIAKQYIASGQIRATSAQSPLTMGEMGIAAAYKLLEGGAVEEHVYLDVIACTIDNVEELGVDGWQ